MARTRIKICGIRDEDGLKGACGAGADAVGFVFHPKSRRFIEPEDAAELLLFTPPFVATVGLFVNPSLEAFMRIEEACPTTHTQLHGEEPPSLVEECAPVIKAVRFDPATIAAELARWGAMVEVDAILVDGSAGGEGKALDWAELAKHRAAVSKPLILAGGLTPENVGEAIRVVRPYAVDVSSGVESEPGVKDAKLMEAFCRAVRRADAALE
jgi:phosphoribosylanthranilate isomerase